MRKALMLAMTLLLIAGCSSKVNMFASFYVEREQSYDDPFYGYRGGDIFSDPVLEELTATINGDTMEMDLPEPGMWNYHNAYFWDEDTIPQEAGSEQAFDIRTDVGNASATCTVPGEFDIAAPLDDDSIPINTDCDVNWGASDGADWYAVELKYFWTGDYKETIAYVDTTAYTVPANWLDMDGTLYIYVHAGDGPRIETGAAGNIDGAKGFCIATNSRSIRLTVGTGYLAPAQLKPDLKRMTPGELYRSYLRELSKYSSDAREMLEYIELD